MITATYTSRALTAAALASLLLGMMPLQVHAERGEGSGITPGARGTANFCQNLDNTRNTALSRVGQQRKDGDHVDDRKTKREERRSSLETKRDEKEGEREARYEQLKNAAQTDAQKAAVETFVNTVQQLLDDRKAAIDAAVAAFEDAVSGLLEQRSEAMSTAANDITDAISEAYSTAQASCDAGDDPADIRAALMDDLKAVRESAKADRGEYSFKDELEAARAERKAAFDAAQATFKEGLDAAKAELRTAFAADSSDE